MKSLFTNKATFDTTNVHVEHFSCLTKNLSEGKSVCLCSFILSDKRCRIDVTMQIWPKAHMRPIGPKRTQHTNDTVVLAGPTELLGCLVDSDIPSTKFLFGPFTSFQTVVDYLGIKLAY